MLFSNFTADVEILTTDTFNTYLHYYDFGVSHFLQGDSNFQQVIEFF